MPYIMSVLILISSTIYPMGEQSIAVIPKNKIIVISAAGDCTIGYDINFGYKGSFNEVVDTYGKDYPFQKVADIFNDDHLTIVNLETTLTNSTERANKTFKFAGSPEYRDILTAGGVEAVNLANNHTYDYLQQGYTDTMANLKSADVGYFGNGNKLVKEINGVRVGMLGYTGWSDNSEMKNKIKNDIAELKKHVQVIIVSFHWGVERSNYPNNTQKNLGRFAIDSGADLVLGHHPHVIQGIEDYKGKIIVYSLANFVFGGNKNPSDKDTFIYQQEFIVSPSGTVQVGEKEVIPASVSSVKYRNDYQPVVLHGTEAEQVMNRINRYSQALEYGIKN